MIKYIDNKKSRMTTQTYYKEMENKTEV